MALFISYSSQDRTSLDGLTAALRRSQQQVWFDEELGGGESWWNKILEQIRQCDMFIVALSNHWLRSKPCQAELRYAQALQRPILPIRIGPVDSVRVNPLAALQIIDYQNPTIDAGIQLITAVHASQAKPQPLPEPLPEEPPVPFGYLMRLGNAMAEKEISPQQQMQMLVELRSGLDEDGDDPSARSDIAQLLRMLRLRHDVTYRTRSEIDNVLASIEAAETGPVPTPAAAAKPEPTTAVAEGSTQPSAQPASGPQRSSGQVLFYQRLNRRTKIWMAVGTVVAVTAVIVGIVVGIQSPSGPRSPSPSPSQSFSAGSPAVPPPSPAVDPTKRLLALVPSEFNCEPGSGPNGGGLAVVDCVTGVDRIPTLNYTLFPDQGRLHAYVTGKVSGGFKPCPGRGLSPLHWQSTTHPQLRGTIKCYTFNGEAIQWSIDPQLVLGFVKGGPETTMDQVYQWWAAHYQ